jgi:hypothetical protein
MLPHKFLIVLLGLLAIMLVELAAEILPRKLPVLLLSVREVNSNGRRDAKLNSPIRWVSFRFPVSIPPQCFAMIRPWDPNCQGGKRPKQSITYCLLFFPFAVLAGGSSSAARICPSTSPSRLQARTNQSSYIAGDRGTYRCTAISSKLISAMIGGLGVVHSDSRGGGRW